MKKSTLYTNRDQELVGFVFSCRGGYHCLQANPVAQRRRHKVHQTWWRHGMETLSASLALCEGNTPVESLHKGPATRALIICFMLTSTKSWSNSRAAGDLTHHETHCDCDVTVMIITNSIYESHCIIQFDRQNITRFVTTSTVTLFKPRDVRFIRLSTLIVNIIISNFIPSLLLNCHINRRTTKLQTRCLLLCSFIQHLNVYTCTNSYKFHKPLGCSYQNIVRYAPYRQSGRVCKYSF